MKWRLEKKGYSEDETNETLHFLKQTGLIEDRLLALGLLRDAIERRHLGRKGIEAFLYQRGIDRDLINELLFHHTNEVEIETAKRLIEKKIKRLKNHPKDIVRRRLIGMLRRRGLSTDVIKRALTEDVL
jgi:regulatory protein